MAYHGCHFGVVVLLPTAVAAVLSSLLPLAAVGDAGGEPRCPAGYYRDSVLVWPCEDASQFQTEMKVDMASVQELGEVPANVTNFAIRLQSPSQGKFQLLNPLNADRNILVGQLGEMSFPWSSLTITEHLVSSLPLEESVKLFGVLPNTLKARIENNGSKEASFIIYYGHEGYFNGTCPDRIPGCARYNASRSAASVDEFSKYMVLEYNDFYWAWTSMPLDNHAADDADKSVKQLDVENVTWPQWKAIWLSRPSTEPESQSEWKEAFHFVDSLIKEDGMISRAEFRKAFDLHKAYDSLCAWTGELHGAVNGHTAAQAWAAIGGGAMNITGGSWKSKWERFILPAGVKKATADDVLPYLDIDDDGFITEEEFAYAYETFYSGAPILLAGLADLNKNETTTTVTTTQAAGSVTDDAAPAGSSKSSSAEDVSGAGHTAKIVVASVVAVIVLILLVFLVLFVMRIGPFAPKVKTFRRDPRRQSREVTGFYEPVTPSEGASGLDTGRHSGIDDYQQSPASLRPVANSPPTGYHPGPYEQQQPQGGGTQTPLSSVSLTTPRSKEPSSNSWSTYNQAYPGAANATPLRYAMDPNSLTPSAAYGDGRFVDRNTPNSQPSMYNGQGMAAPSNTGYLSAQSSFSSGVPYGTGSSLPSSMNFPMPQQQQQQGGMAESFRLGQPAGFQQPYIGPT